MGRPRDGAEIQAETILAMIAHRAGLKPTGKPAPSAARKPVPLCGSEREFERRKRVLREQAEALESETSRQQGAA